MNILEIITKKRDNKKLTKEEIEYFIKGYTEGKIADYQIAALIMAIYINGMDEEETYNLSMQMAKSGDILDLSEIGKTVVDKHSTGGVGDKVSIILLPIIASLGIPVAKMSGRGLGFTGGTVDKLESIPGYRTNIEIKEFIENVKKVGISMIGQTGNLAPADKKIYALRDAIACVESMPLIASSIMSKKIASGASKIVIELTVGKGAFMETQEKAEKLARQMIEIGKRANLEVECVFTDMNEPLGFAVGNNLEIIEAIESLKGKMPKDVEKVVLEVGSYMIKLAGMGENLEENKQKMLEEIQSKKAFNKFKEMVKNQGGDVSYIEDTNRFPKAKYQIEIKSKQDGKIEEINAKEVGKVVCNLGAGRIKKEDQIEMEVGVILSKKVGEEVVKGETLAKIYANDESKLEEAKKEMEKIYKIV